MVTTWYYGVTNWENHSIKGYTMKQVHVRFKKDVFNWIKEQAKKQNRSINNFISNFFEEIVTKIKKETEN